MDGIPARDSTPKRMVFVNQDSFVYSVRKIAVPTPRGVATKMDKRTRKMVPTIVEKIPPCLPISSGDEKMNSMFKYGDPLKKITATMATRMPTVKNAWKFNPIFTILSTNLGLILTSTPFVL